MKISILRESLLFSPNSVHNWMSWKTALLLFYVVGHFTLQHLRLKRKEQATQNMARITISRSRAVSTKQSNLNVLQISKYTLFNYWVVYRRYIQNISIETQKNCKIWIYCIKDHLVLLSFNHKRTSTLKVIVSIIHVNRYLSSLNQIIA